MERATALSVPLRTDPVAPCRLASGALEVAGGSERRRDIADTALFFEVAERGTLGRVTFEGLDSIRMSRGEYMPYDNADDYSGWVYRVDESTWLTQRHTYEFEHYETPMLDRHSHFLLVFHDDFVEALAEGIWLDQPSAQDPFRIASGHPLAPFGLTDPHDAGTLGGLDWEVRRSPKDQETLLRDAQLCSQRLFQFNLLLDGNNSEAASCWLRHGPEGPYSTLSKAWTGTMASVPGVARLADLMPAWASYCAEVAERRRAMGK